MEGVWIIDIKNRLIISIKIELINQRINIYST